MGFEYMTALQIIRRANCPFDLDDEAAYRRWREWKLTDYPSTVQALIVEVRDPFQLSQGERQALVAHCRKTNMALYQTAQPGSKEMVRALGLQLGLRRLDANLCADTDHITSIQMLPEAGRRYIPYTNKPLNWHTDGYYNTPAQTIRAFMMHCVEPASRGGENGLLDPEIAYIMMRDHHPAYIAALMQPDAMTIPANVEGEAELRPPISSPVFSVDEASGCLYMRYTARLRNIAWKPEPNVQAAAAFLQDLCVQGSPYRFSHRLKAGQGLICNNVLHSRSAFVDEDPTRHRLLYRARYYDRVADTAPVDLFEDAPCCG